MVGEFTPKPSSIRAAVAGTIARADDYNKNIAGQSKDSILGIDADGEFDDVDIGDETIGTNGALVKDLKVRETNQLEIYNSLGVLIGSVPWEDLTSPTGAVTDFAFETPPAGWLECDGSAISRTTFSVLFTAVGVRFGIGNGSTTFNIPDLRGETRRGWDHGRGADPDAGSRTDSGDGTTGDNVGTKQDDAFQSHTHTGTGGLDTNPSSTLFTVTGSAAINTATTNATGGSETRPRNVSMMACIKF